MPDSNTLQTPTAVQTAVIIKSAMGESNSQIGRDLEISHQTVGRILERTGCKEILEKAREDAVALAPLAVEAVKHTLSEKKDGWLGEKFLRSVGVLQEESNQQVTEFTVNIQHIGSDAD